MRYQRDAILQFLADQADSKRTVAEFCAEHGLKVPTFYAWRRKYAARETLQSEGFCKIVPRSEMGWKKLRFPSGLELELSGLSTPELADLIVAIDRAHA